MSTRNQGGQWKKGIPSPNPSGRYAVTKAAQPAGVDGVASYNGYLTYGERSADLVGFRKWITLSNTLQKAMVATGVRLFTSLLSGTEWHCEANAAGGRGARKGQDIVTKGLLEAALDTPWATKVRKQSMYKMLGFGLHATAMRRRPDGMIVYSRIEHRPQFTIERWNRRDEFSPWASVTQRSPQSGAYLDLPLEECWYTVDDTITDSPDGVGLLRHVVEHVRRLEVYEMLEGKAYGEDLGGIPIGRAPLAEIERSNTGKTADQIRADKDVRTQAMRDVLDKRKKTPADSQWLLLDSDVQANPDGTKTNTPKWGLELVKSETANLPDINQVITRVRFEIACVLGIEFVLLGSGDAGSFALSQDKTNVFATNLQTALNELGWSATHQLARRLVAANGLDPDTCTPTLVAEPISTDTVEIATRSLMNLAMAGLPPNDPARNIIRNRLRLPPEPAQAYDLVRPSRLIPAVGDPAAAPPGEAAVDPQKPSAGAAPANSDVKPGPDPTGAEQLKPGVKRT